MVLLKEVPAPIPEIPATIEEVAATIQEVSAIIQENILNVTGLVGGGWASSIRRTLRPCAISNNPRVTRAHTASLLSSSLLGGSATATTSVGSLRKRGCRRVSKPPTPKATSTSILWVTSRRWLQRKWEKRRQDVVRTHTHTQKQLRSVRNLRSYTWLPQAPWLKNMPAEGEQSGHHQQRHDAHNGEDHRPAPCDHH